MSCQSLSIGFNSGLYGGRNQDYMEAEKVRPHYQGFVQISRDETFGKLN